jgi:acyl-CoA thioesterase
VGFLLAPEVLTAEARDQAALGASADHHGAVDAFLAKRPPECHRPGLTSGIDAPEHGEARYDQPNVQSYITAGGTVPRLADADDPVIAMMAADKASGALGIELLEYGPGWARTRMVVRHDMVNGHSISHGGLIFSLADTAFACACNSWGPATVAAGCDIVFVAAARAGDQLEAHAQVRARYGRSGIYDVTVSRGAEVIAEFRGRSHQLRE